MEGIFGDTSSVYNSRLQTFGGFPRARSEHNFKNNPLWLAAKTLDGIRKDDELKELTTDEIESTFRLTPRQREHAAKLLEEQGAKKTVTTIDATWYDMANVCSALPTPEAQANCGKLEARVRSQTDHESGMTKWFWAIKVNGNPDGITRPETQGVHATKEAAHTALREALQRMLDLDTPPALDTPSLTLVKTRTTYRFDAREPGDELPCTKSEMDIDEWVTLQGKSLTPPVITIDIEGPSVAAIEECRHCMQEHLPPPEDKEDVWKEWNMGDVLKEHGVADKKK